VQRLKDARVEAEAEIEALKAAKKEEFLAFEKSIVSGLDEAVLEQTRATEAELLLTKVQAAAKRETVLQLLVDKVLAVQPALHPNALYKQGSQKSTDNGYYD